MPAPIFSPERVSAVDPISRFCFPHHWLVCAGLMLFACAPGGGGIEDYSSSLDPAIELFVEGRYAEAAARLEKLTDDVDSSEGLTELYLYLGRAYLELEQYDRAIDAFTAGVSYGGTGPFQEYLMRLSRMKESEPGNIARAEKITRAQLALTIDRVVYRADPGEVSNMAPDESETFRRGVMTNLADGEFHGGAYVTRASFYAIVCALLDGGSEGGSKDRIFPGGFAWVTHIEPGGAPFVSGKEAVSILEKVAALGASSNDG